MAGSSLLIQLAESSSETSLNLSTITLGIWKQSSVSEIGVNWSELGLNEKIKSPNPSATRRRRRSGKLRDESGSISEVRNYIIAHINLTLD